MFGGSHGVPKICNLGRNPNTANPRPNLAIKGPKTGGDTTDRVTQV